MNEHVAEYLKGKIVPETWITKLAALVRPVDKIQWIDSGDGQPERFIRKRYPIAASIGTDCEDSSVLKELLPNDAHAAVGFFEDNGCQFIKVEGNKTYFVSTLRFVCWINLQKIDTNAVSISGIAVARIIKRLPLSLIDNSGILQKVQIKSVTEVPKGPEIFYPKYSMDSAQVPFLVYPFDYFALTIQTSFCIDMNCIPAITTTTKCDII